MECRLILVTPADLRPPLAPFADALAAALEAGDVACVVLRGAGLDDETLTSAVALLRPLVQGRDAAFLIRDRAEIAAAAGGDGVHLGDPRAYRAARKTMGDDAIVGVECGDSRHDAMVAGEREADYVAFGRLGPEPGPADPDLLTWWQEMMTVPCVALGAASVEDCARLARAGADFVAVDGPVWDHPEGPATAVRAIVHAIASPQAS